MTDPHRLRFHFADSEVAQVTATPSAPQQGRGQTTLRIRFSAACASRADGTVLHGRGVELHLLGATPTTAQPHPDQPTALGRLATGQVHHTHQTLRTLPFPTTLIGPLHIELIFSQGTVLAWHATGLQLGQDEGGEWFESMAC